MRTFGQAAARLACVALLALVSLVFPATSATVHAAAPTLDADHTAQITGRGHRQGQNRYRPRARMRQQYRSRSYGRGGHNMYGNRYGGQNYGSKGKSYGGRNDGGKRYGNKGYGNRSYGNKGYGNRGYGNKGYGGKSYGGKGYGGYGYGGSDYGGSDYGGSDYGGSYDSGSTYGSSPSYPDSSAKGATVAEEMTLSAASNDALGAYLTGPTGMTLYWFDEDSAGQSTCYDDCAQLWPPLLVAENAVVGVGEGVTGALSTMERSDGTYQVTYNGRPLYYYAADQQPGDTIGHGVDGTWWVATP
jgi:predicted lipoprotein with Yx(FWY)xxD motif